MNKIRVENFRSSKSPCSAQKEKIAQMLEDKINKFGDKLMIYSTHDNEKDVVSASTLLDQLRHNGNWTIECLAEKMITTSY